jgi:hypothetical protein
VVSGRRQNSSPPERNVPERQPIRVHDLRASFVTLAVAIGKSEAWLTDRTGHKSSAMIARYKRTARLAEELNLGWFAPMHLALPELAPKRPPRSGGGDRSSQLFRFCSDPRNST